MARPARPARSSYASRKWQDNRGFRWSGEGVGDDAFDPQRPFQTLHRLAPETGIARLARLARIRCLLPLTPETRGILNRDTLGRLQPGGVLINVARGAHLVEEDLLALLDEGHLAAATLDVFRTEPLPSDHPFWQHPKITVTPHMSARTLRDETIAQIAHKIGAL